MAKLSNYTGSVELADGVKPKNNGSFPLMEAHDIVVDESGKRLDTALEDLANNSGGNGATVEIVQEKGNSETAVMSQKAVTDSFDDLNIQLTDDGEGNVNIHMAEVGGDGLLVVQNTGLSPVKVMSQKAVTEEITPLKNALTVQTNSVEETTADNTLANTVYAKNFPNGTTLGSYTTYEKNVVAGEHYFITCKVPANKNYAVALFFDENGYVDGQGFNETGAAWAVTDYEVIIPDGCTIMRTSMLTTNPYAIKKLVVTNSIYNPVAADQEIIAGAGTAIAYRLQSNILDVCTKHGNNKDLMVTLKPKGGNGLFDFYSFSTIENEAKTPSTDFDNYTSIGSSTTDWHAPFQVVAVNNIDGDNLKEDSTYRAYFTGGNHQYNNLGYDSTPTARLGSLRFFVNGKEIESGSGYASHLEIRWTNYVQGYNTTKADGSGREILQENHTLKFDGVEWKTEVELVPLEEISIVIWYGLQASIGSVYSTIFNDTVRYVGSTNRQPFAANATASECGSTHCQKIICSGLEHCMEIEIDETYDIGNRELYSGTQGGFVTTSNKAYHYIIKNKNNIPQNEHYYLRGFYRFYPV